MARIEPSTQISEFGPHTSASENLPTRIDLQSSEQKELDSLKDHGREQIAHGLGQLIALTQIINKRLKAQRDAKADYFVPPGLPGCDAATIIADFRSLAKCCLHRAVGVQQWELLSVQNNPIPDRLVDTVVRRWRRLSYRKARTAEYVRESEPAQHVRREHNVSAKIQGQGSLEQGPEVASAVTQAMVSPMPSKGISAAVSFMGGSTLPSNADVRSKTSLTERRAHTLTVIAATGAVRFPSLPPIKQLNDGVEISCPYCGPVYEQGLSRNLDQIWQYTISLLFLLSVADRMQIALQKRLSTLFLHQYRM